MNFKLWNQILWKTEWEKSLIPDPDSCWHMTTWHMAVHEYWHYELLAISLLTGEGRNYIILSINWTFKLELNQMLACVRVPTI